MVQLAVLQPTPSASYKNTVSNSAYHCQSMIWQIQLDNPINGTLKCVQKLVRKKKGFDEKLQSRAKVISRENGFKECTKIYNINFT